MKIKEKIIPGTGDIRKTRWHRDANGTWHLEGSTRTVRRGLKPATLHIHMTDCEEDEIAGK